jgi:Phage tail tube protein
MAQASFGYFGVGVESTPGTAVAPTKFLPVKDVDFPVETDFIEIREIRGSRQAYSNFDGPVRPSVTFTSSFYPSGAMGVLLKGLFGSVTTAATLSSTTAKTHTFGDAAVLPSLSFERSDTRAGGGIIHQRTNGCKVETLGFSAAYGEDVEVSCTAQGLGFPTTPGSKPGAFPYPSADPFIFTGATVSIDGTANNLFKTIDFEFTNTLERQETLRGTREAYKLYEGGLACSLSGTLVFDDLTLYTALRNSTQISVEATFVGAQIASDGPGNIFYEAEFTWPKVKVSNFGIPMTAGEVMEADVEFQVSFDFATSKLVGVTLTNLEVSGTYDT